MKSRFYPVFVLAILALSSLVVAGCDSNEDEDGPHNDVFYVRISVPGEQFYAASETQAINPILVAVNTEYDLLVDFLTEEGVVIDYAGYTYQVTLDDAIATFAPEVRDGEFYATVKGITVGETGIRFRLRQEGKTVWTSARAELKVVQ